MAFKKVVIPETGPKNYETFDAIGDKKGGFYVGKAVVTGNFGPKTEYTFRTKEGKDFTISASYNLKAGIEAALADEKTPLQPGMRVIMRYVRNVDTGQASPMKIIEVEFDPSEIKLPPLAAPAPKKDDDDIGF